METTVTPVDGPKPRNGKRMAKRTIINENYKRSNTMKKSIIKIITLAISLCMLLGAVIGVSAFASDTADLTNARNVNGVYDFEGATLGSIPVGTNAGGMAFSQGAAEISIVEANGGKALQLIESSNTSQTVFKINFDGATGVNTAKLSFRMMMTSAGNDRIYIHLNNQSGDRIVRVPFGGNGKNITVGKAGTDMVAVENTSLKEWVDVDVVYYEGDDASYTNRSLSIFINGELCAERTAFDRNSTADNWKSISFVTATKWTGNVSFDNFTMKYSNVATPEIISKNVSYSDNLFLYYAVPKASITTGETPKLIGTDKNGSYEVTNYTEDTVGGIDCYIFRSRGIPAKELNTTQTVRIAAGDAMSEAVTYSVEQYLYEKLYDEGYIAEDVNDNTAIGKNDGKDNIRKNVYLKLLEYGALVQQLLVENISDPIADTPYVSINGTDVEVSGEYDLETEFTLNAPTSGDKTVASYKVVTSDAFGEKITTTTAAVGDTIKIGGFTLVYPIYAE